MGTPNWCRNGIIADPKRYWPIHQLSTRVVNGFLGVNGAAGYGADVPFGGYKASGIGRQNGFAGFDQYTEIKSVAHPVD